MKSADDTKLRGIINTEDDWNILQKELDDLEEKHIRNGIKLNGTECKVMHLGLAAKTSTIRCELISCLKNTNPLRRTYS